MDGFFGMIEQAIKFARDAPIAEVEAYARKYPEAFPEGCDLRDTFLRAVLGDILIEDD